MVCARSAAMSFNRLADRELDQLNPRTRNRHLPTGVLTVRSVAVFAAVAALSFVAATALFLPNRLPCIFPFRYLGSCLLTAIRSGSRGPPISGWELR